MANLVDILRERGFIEQTTHDEELRDHFDTHRVTGYIGFDPTASSLHIGSLVPIMSLAHMQRQGHRPIALVGGGTGMVGDPSGKTEMRKLLSLRRSITTPPASKSSCRVFWISATAKPCCSTMPTG